MRSFFSVSLVAAAVPAAEDQGRRHQRHRRWGQRRLPQQLACFALYLTALLAFTTTSCLAAATLIQQIDPAEAGVGDQVIVTLTIQNGSTDNLRLPQVDGLQVVGTRSSSSFSVTNGNVSRTTSFNFALVPSRPGDFTIPAFDIHTQEGDTLHVKAMKLHVLGNTTSPSTNNTPAQVAPSPAQSPAASVNPPVNPNGPVVMPPANVAPPAPATGNPADTTGTNASVPRDPGGGPAKVFIIITPQTTDAYVGQAIPLRIDFYIRLEVAANQNSLPTIKGSDFLMNNFTRGGQGRVFMLEDQQYGCETWITAISAPKSGDFPLSMVRDTYWIKSINNNGFNPFGGFGFFNRQANLAHEPISSNQLTMHIHALPTEGQPAHFTGAIGQFQVTGSANPTSVAVGEPVTLDFSVSGEGNFDYVRCPVLPGDPAWKGYVPSSSINYRDESHTHAVKTFEQAVIPQRNGSLQLPQASFSYFDPTAKQYVTVPIALPEITVTGSPLPIASATPADGSDSTAAAATPKSAELIPNRLESGSPRMSLTPVYRQPWFWAVQGGLIFLPVLGALFLLLRSRITPDNDRAERALRQRSQQQEEDAMADAVRRNDAVAFFLAARHAIQLQLGAQWNLKPEALTLGEIRGRDPQLAETLEPLFTQADEVIYSGHASPGLDLAQWERHVRELPQLQTA